MQTIRTKDLKPSEQFQTISDDKLRLTLIGMADKYSEQARTTIYMSYNDPKLHRIYRQIRSSGVYQKGNLSNGRRKILEFPNGWVYDFVNTIMTALYDRDWMQDNRALTHEIVKPWLVVSRI